MPRRLFTLLSALSLLLCAGVLALWVCGCATNSMATGTTAGGCLWWVRPGVSGVAVNAVDDWPERWPLRWSSHPRGAGAAGDGPWLVSLPAPAGGSSLVPWNGWGLEGQSGPVRAAMNPDGTVRRERAGRPSTDRWSAPLAFRSIRVPYWPLAAATALLPAVAAARQATRRWRGKWRHRAGLCPSCGYDLRATPGRCPECGRASKVPPAGVERSEPPG